MEPKNVNPRRLFQVPPRNWPVVNRGNAINWVQKILKSNHVTGVPTHWPKIYYGQTRANLNLSRTYRNTNVATLPDGAYLYLIEYNPETNMYHKSFVRVHNLLESGSRHFQLPVRNQGRVILAAGELSKNGQKVVFNLESGTYTRNIMRLTDNYVKEANYIALVKNALRNSIPNKTYVTNILVPQIPGTIENLLKRGECSFYHGTPTNKVRERIKANLKKAGLTTNSAQNLIRALVQKKCGVPPNSSKRKRPPKNNGGPPEAPLRRSARTARRT